MLIAPAPLIAAIIGLLLYATVSKEPWKEFGRALMWCGIFLTMLAMAGKTIHLF